MSFFQFGIGGLFAIPTTGNLATPSGPVQFGTIQDTNVEFNQKLEKLMGQNKGPDDIAPSDMEIKGKSGFGRIDVNIYNALFFGETIATGISVTQPNEAHAIPATPFTVTVAPPNSGTFSKDLGVRFASNLQALTRVTSGPTTGQYSVTAGAYLFAAADTLLNVQISYEYTLTSGQTLTVTNRIQGYGPVFELYLNQPYQGTNGLHLRACRASKMSAPMKRNGYLISDFEFESFPDAGGNWFDWFQA
jgi:hypothetical protein